MLRGNKISKHVNAVRTYIFMQHVFMSGWLNRSVSNCAFII